MKYFIDRLKLFDTITSNLNDYDNGDELCIESKRIGDNIIMSHHFGTPSVYGEAWIAMLANKQKIKFAVKKIPLTIKDLTQSYTKKQLASGTSVWGEMSAYMLCRVLILSKVCPNLPLIYKYMWCNECSFINKNIRPRNGPCLLVLNELADGDLKMYLEKHIQIWSHELVINCLFQVTAGLYAMEKFYGATHNDLHYGNVLVHRVTPGGYWQYTINKKVFNVENIGFVFTLWDFGMTHIQGKVKGRRSKKGETDIGRISSIMMDLLSTNKAKKFSKMGNAPNTLLQNLVKLEGKISLEYILDNGFHDFQENVNKKDVLDNYNMDISKAKIKALHPSLLSHLLK